MKQFFPNQVENVFTHNNWLLSDELVEIFGTNLFYKEHVKWNIKRFTPDSEISTESDTENQDETSSSCTLHPNNFPETTMGNNSQEVLPPSDIINNPEGEITSDWSSCLRPKRKVPLNDNANEHQARTQPRRLKKN